VLARQVAAYAGLLAWAFLAGGPASATAGEATRAYPPFGLLETSGMALSVLHDGVVWVVEDSGEPPDDLPVVRAFDPSGAEVGSVTLAGWNNRDTEALSMGPGPTLWVADIGDNLAVRETVVVHTFEEPAELGPSTLEPVSYRLRYPDGPRDAEAIMVDPVDSRVYVATKSAFGAGSLYVAPATLAAGETHDLALVSSLPSWITDGSFTPDGARLVLLRALPSVRGEALTFEVTRPGAGAPMRLAEGDAAQLPDQEQGESLTITSDGATTLVGSEGADEPIWAVPLPAGPSQPTRPTAGESSAAPGGSDVTAGPDACRLADPMSCLDGRAGWFAATGVALAGLIVGALAVLRRRDGGQRRPTM